MASAKEKVHILLLEDNDRIRGGYIDLLNAHAKRNSISALIEDFDTDEDAVRRLSTNSEVHFDLILTDINLSDGPDFSGLAVARFAKDHFSSTPIVGLSAVFDDGDLLDAEKHLFDKWWSKSAGFNHIDAIVADAIARAQQHATNAALGKRAVPTEVDELAMPAGQHLYRSQGYVQEFLAPPLAKGWIAPISVWRKESDEGVELEVFGCNSLYSWGETLGEARENLEALVEDYRETFAQSPDAFGSEVLLAREFAMKIVGYRNAETR